MDSVQRKVAAQVRLHKHLYDSSMREHKDSEMIANSWREIADNLGEEEAFCRRLWKNIRDRYVKAKKRSHMKCSVLGGVAPPILLELGWLAQFTRHRETDRFDYEDDGVVRTKVHRASQEISNQDEPKSSQEVRVPRSSLHLVVPPLRLMSACMWQVAKERNVDHYGRLAEFVAMVTDSVPELLNYKQKIQLILGLRARLILEDLKRNDKVDYKTTQDHLDSFQEWTTKDINEEDRDGEVEFSKSAFMELVQTLLTNESEKNKYFKEVFSVQYGARFDTSLQILVWEFFSRLEEFLPVPSFSQVSSMFDISSTEQEFEQFAYDPEDLKRIFQHQQERHKLAKSEFTLMSDTILSALASKQTSVISEDFADQKIIQIKLGQKTVKQEDSCSSENTCEDDEETDDSSTEANPNSRLNEYGLSPLTSSSCYDDADADAAGDDETAGEAAFQPHRRSRSSDEGAKEHLDLSRNEEASEKSVNQSGGRADVTVKTELESEKTSASRSSLLKNHHDAHSPVRLFKCTQCQRPFKRRNDLKRHYRVHSSVKIMPFTCKVCDKKFSSRTIVKNHMRSHSGERPYACTYCDKRFMTSSVLRSHERIHTGERPYVCSFCNRTFIQSYTYTVHLRVHKKEKPYLCSTCGMSYPSSGALLVHSRTHTGERPYQCDVCGNRFTTCERMRRHRRFHTGERPYSCSECAKSFHCGSGLKKHIRTHTGEKPFKCLTCHKTFAEKSNMKIHLRVHKK
ncbi:uncharacterized protein AB9X84_020054 isoform 1-T1 [Acanthopagrus schlegelii]